MTPFSGGFGCFRCCWAGKAPLGEADRLLGKEKVEVERGARKRENGGPLELDQTKRFPYRSQVLGDPRGDELARGRRNPPLKAE